MEWKSEPYALDKLLHRGTNAVSSLLEDSPVQLELCIDENLPEMAGDAERLIQVVINLLSNAIKFTKEGRIVCKATQKGQEIVVSVQDSGIGIPEHECNKVFERFKQIGDTLTDKPKGTGLGLPICKQIVEHHGGQIGVESVLGEGSTFFFTLPISSQTPTVQPNDISLQGLFREVEAHFSPPNIGQKSVLIVDDEPNIRELIRQELSEKGYHIWEAKDGKEAVEQARLHQPSLILLDIMLPEMNGFDVAAILKNDPKTKELPIVILSIVDDKERGFQLGVERYLTKPINTNELLQAVEGLTTAPTATP